MLDLLDLIMAVEVVGGGPAARVAAVEDLLPEVRLGQSCPARTGVGSAGTA
jgi:hypothetical protein